MVRVSFDRLGEIEPSLVPSTMSCNVFVISTAHPQEVDKIIREGSEKARIEAQKILSLIFADRI